MMELPESTREKSVMLAKAMGWDFVPDAIYPWYDGNDYVVTDGSCLDFYQEESMVLAWRVLQWALYRGEDGRYEWLYGSAKWIRFEEWYARNAVSIARCRQLKNSQAAWLDKILKLAIEAGLTEEKK